MLAWLYTIARNLVTDYHRRRKHPQALPLEEDRIAALAGPEQTVERRSTLERLIAAIAQLTEDQRQVILLKFVEELDNAAVARILGRPVGAIKALQHRALAALRRILERNGIP